MRQQMCKLIDLANLKGRKTKQKKLVLKAFNGTMAGIPLKSPKFEGGNTKEEN